MPWPFPPLPDLKGPWIAVPLASPSDPVGEAIALHHFADRRAAACAAGRERLFGIRRRDDGTRVATLELSWYGVGTWPAVVEAKGLLNRHPPEAPLDFAKRFAWPIAR